MKEQKINLEGRMGGTSADRRRATYGYSRLGIISDDTPAEPAAAPVAAPPKRQPAPSAPPAFVIAPEAIDQPQTPPPDPADDMPEAQPPAEWQPPTQAAEDTDSTDDDPGLAASEPQRQPRRVWAATVLVASVLLALGTWWVASSTSTPQAAQGRPTAAVPQAPADANAPAVANATVPIQRRPEVPAAVVPGGEPEITSPLRTEPAPAVPAPIHWSKLPPGGMAVTPSQGTDLGEPGTVAARPPQPASQPVAQPAPAVKTGTAYLTTSNLRVTCIMGGSEGRMAIINGRTVEVGQTIQEAKIVAITDMTVEIEIDGQHFMLGITAPPAAPVAPADVEPSEEPAPSAAPAGAPISQPTAEKPKPKIADPIAAGKAKYLRKANSPPPADGQ